MREASKHQQREKRNKIKKVEKKKQQKKSRVGYRLFYVNRQTISIAINVVRWNNFSYLSAMEDIKTTSCCFSVSFSLVFILGFSYACFFLLYEPIRSIDVYTVKINGHQFSMLVLFDVDMLISLRCVFITHWKIDVRNQLISLFFKNNHFFLYSFFQIKYKQPGPIPGMRPPMGAGSVHQPQQKGNSMGLIMPLYTIGIVAFFVYTIMKVIDFFAIPVSSSLPKNSIFHLQKNAFDHFS